MELKAGDKMRVRSWESMEEEFGIDFDGGIKCMYGFADEMRRFCKSLVTIKRMDSSGLCKIEEDGGCWFWSTDMFEPVEKMLSADEVWKWLGKHYCDEAFDEVFCDDPYIREASDDFYFSSIIDKFSFTEVTEKISAYVWGQEKPKFYNGNIVCVKTPYSHFTVGKKYEVKDGCFFDDDGCKFGNDFTQYKSFEEIEKYLDSKFIELVEG